MCRVIEIGLPIFKKTLLTINNRYDIKRRGKNLPSFCMSKDKKIVQKNK